MDMFILKFFKLIRDGLCSIGYWLIVEIIEKLYKSVSIFNANSAA